ncbi:MAG: cation:proton antiporter [Rubrivivax sp.]
MTSGELSIYFFLQAAVIVASAQLAGRVARRIGQPPVVGEMVAGVMLGPSLFGLVLPQWQQALFPKPTMGTLYVLAQLGVGLYMFIVGLGFDAAQFRRRARSAMSVSVAGVAVPFVLAFALAPWLQTVSGLFAPTARPLEASLFLGAAIAITAFPMLARIVHERGLTGTSLGTLTLAAGAFDDAASWCILAVVLASFGGSWASAWAAIGGGIAFAAAMLLFGRRLLQRLGEGLGGGPGADEPRSGTYSPGPLPAGVLAAVLVLFCLSAFAMDAIGIHAVFGGFLLGCSLPRGPLTHKLREMLQPFVVVFLLPMFFTYSGLNTRLDLLLQPALMLAAVAILLASFCGKGVACWAAARLNGEANSEAMAIGALMNARGLMELIIINIGLAAGVIEVGLFSILVLMAVVTTLMATPLFDWIVRRDASMAPPAEGTREPVA